MTKQLRYLCTLLLCMIASVGWVKADNYNITFTTSSSDGSTEIKTTTQPSTVISDNAIYVSGFTGNCTKAYYKCKNGVKLSSSSVSGVLEFNIKDDYQNYIKSIKIISAKYGTEDSSISLYVNGETTALSTNINPGEEFVYTFENAIKISSIKLSSTKRSYISKIVLTSGEAPSTTATTTTIDDTGITNTDVYTSTAAGSLSATVTANNEAISGATVTWASSDEGVATIDANGAVTLVAAGTTTITATYAGVTDQYQASSATYELTVIDSTPCVTFVAKNDKDEQNTTRGAGSIIKEGITFTCTDGILGNESEYRLYQGSETTFSVTSGKIIKIVFTDASQNPCSNLTLKSGESGSYNNNTWTGNAASVTFTASAQARATKIVVFIENDGSIAAPIISGITPFYPNTLVTITATEDATITYSIDNGETWGDYYEPFVIDATTTVEAVATKDGKESETTSKTFTYFTPISVNDAMEIIPETGTTDDVYVTGIVSAFYETNTSVYDDNYHRYYISDDGTTEKQLLVYNGKGLDNIAFDEEKENGVQISDVVIIRGKLTNYQGTKEFAKDNYIVSLTRNVKEDAGLTFSAETAEVVRGQNFTAPELTNPNNVDVTYSSSNEAVATVNAEGAVTLLKAGETTITASFAGDANYKAGSASYTLTVTVPSHNITFFVNGVQQGEPVSIAEDEAITFPEATQEINGKTFVGWTTGVLEGEQAAAPTTLVKAATMGTSDVTYYAVYANVEGESKTATLTANDDFGTTYTAKEFTDDQNNLWVAVCNSTTKEEIIVYGLTKNDKNPYIQSPVFDGNITEIKVWAFNGSSTKDRTFILKNGEEEEVGSIPVAASSSNSELSASLIGTTFSQFTMTASDALQFSKIAVTYGNATYSDYCTTVLQDAGISISNNTWYIEVGVNKNFWLTNPNKLDVTFTSDNEDVVKDVQFTSSAKSPFQVTGVAPGEATITASWEATEVYKAGSIEFIVKVLDPEEKGQKNNPYTVADISELVSGLNGKLPYMVYVKGIIATMGENPTVNACTFFISDDGSDASTFKIDRSTYMDHETFEGTNRLFVGDEMVIIIDRLYNNPTDGIGSHGMWIKQRKSSAPTFSVTSGTYAAEQSVEIACANEAATIYYTLDGSTPTKESAVYESAITISESATLKTIAWLPEVSRNNNVDVAESYSDVATATYTIETPVVEPSTPAEITEGFYTIKNLGNEQFVNVAGRKTVTFVDEATTATAPGTVIKVSSNADGQVQILRSQGVDIPGYAQKAMNYVPEIVQLVVEKLNNLDPDQQIMGENGMQALLNAFNEGFDYHLYTEQAEGGIRIYGKTPSMEKVVKFYEANTANVDAKLPMLESLINKAIDKVLEKTGGSGASILKHFSLAEIWTLMGSPSDIAQPTEDTETQKAFLQWVLRDKTRVWNFAYQTAMIYWKPLINHDKVQQNLSQLGDLAQYVTKIENIQPESKYYIVQNEGKLDVFNVSNIMITEDDARTIWTLSEPRTEFKVNFNEENTLNGKYYTTLYTDFAYTLPEGVKAMTVTKVSELNGKSIAITEAIEGAVPAQTPVLLESESADAQTLTLSIEDGAAPTDNLLKGPDYLINEYGIKTAQVQDLFLMVKDILGETFYQNYIEKYEHLTARNAGTVNNKYFFGLDDADIELCTYDSGNSCVVRNLSTGDEELGFYDNWTVDANKAFLVSETNPVKLWLKGDVDRDGDVDYDDVKALVKIVLGEVTEGNNPNNYDFDAAKVNEDTEINIADVTALVNILLP